MGRGHKRAVAETLRGAPVLTRRALLLLGCAMWTAACPMRGTIDGEGEGEGEGEDCVALDAAYAELATHDACAADADCHVLAGDCRLTTCFVVAHTSITQDALDARARAFVDAGCSAAECDCAPPPVAARCDDGRCVGRFEERGACAVDADCIDGLVCACADDGCHACDGVAGSCAASCGP